MKQELPKPRQSAVISLAVFTGYIFLSLLSYGRALDWHRFLLANVGGDAWSFVWFLNWWPWSIMHGHNPLYSSFVYAPHGYDLTWATAVPTAALLALPITLIFGAFVLSTSSVFWLLHSVLFLPFS